MKRSSNTGLTPIADLLLPELLLPGLVLPPRVEPVEPLPSSPPPQAKAAMTVQGKAHYSQRRQLDDLVAIANDQNPDMGFMTRLLTLCSLPRTDPGERLQYKRQNGPYKLVMIAGGDNKLPYGNIPRLLLAWVSTEVIQTQSRTLVLGPSLIGFMRKLGLTSDSGGVRSDRLRLRTQIDRLFNAHVQLIYETNGYKSTTSSAVADRTELWWDYNQPEQDTIWNSRVRLGEALYEEIIKHPVPLDMRILKNMRRSSLGLDLYMWLSYKTFNLYSEGKKPERLSWARLYRQFGVNPNAVDDPAIISNFRRDVLRELTKLKVAWPTLDYAIGKGCLEVRPCLPSINPKAIAGR